MTPEEYLATNRKVTLFNQCVCEQRDVNKAADQLESHRKKSTLYIGFQGNSTTIYIPHEIKDAVINDIKNRLELYAVVLPSRMDTL